MRNPLFLPRRLLLFLGLGATALSQAQLPPRPELLVFAASSLTDVLGDLSAAYEQQSGVRVKLSFAASSVLARQIEAGSGADVFVSADQEWMDYLEQRQRLADGSRRNLIGNRLVLIAPANNRIALAITPGFALAAALGDGRLAMADPDTVPAGRYARAALTQLGVWNEVRPRIARADNVRTALMYVARGETPLGIVYATDAAMEPRVRIVGTFPSGLHAAITYPAAAMRAAKPAAKAYLDFLGSQAAGATWKNFRFEELSPVPDTAK